MKRKSFLTSNAKGLRNSCTYAERLLWRHLRGSQLEGVKFRRQEPIEAFVVDFISFEKRIAIELDGGQHTDSREYDAAKDGCLRANGFTVLRFWNNELLTNTEGVLEIIRQHLLE